MIASTALADRITYRHSDVYRYVKRKNSIVTKNDKQHMLKMIEDFIYAIEYINQFALDTLENENSAEYISKVKERRDSYVFFYKLEL